MSTAIPATAPEARGTRNVSDILIQSEIHPGYFELHPHLSPFCF